MSCFVQRIDLAEIAPLTVVLLVSAIPVALPTMFTINMALGTLELSRKRAIVTRLELFKKSRPHKKYRLLEDAIE